MVSSSVWFSGGWSGFTSIPQGIWHGHNPAMIDLSDIEQAALRIQGQILETPCVESRTISQITGAQVFLKFENLQYTASFQGTRGLQQAGAAGHGTARRQRVWWPCLRATMPGAWLTTRSGWA